MLLKNKESGYSLLEVSVALGIAAIVATAGVVASTAFIGNSAEKRDNYVENADGSILNAEEEYLKTVAGFWANNTAELKDVNFASETAGDGQALFFNGSQWANGLLNFEYLAEVVLNSPQNGDVLTWDGESWVNGEASPPNINALTDVDFSNSPNTGSALIFDGEEWVDGNEGQPGMIKLWVNSDAPDGWLIADGRAVSRSTYSALFSEIGLTYGAGNGSTTFNLPDFSGRVGIGSDTSQTEFNTLGKTGGQKTVTLTEAQMPTHTHTQQAHGHAGTASNGGAHGHTGTADAAGVHTHGVTLNSATAPTHTFSGRTGTYNGNPKPRETTVYRNGTQNLTSGAAGNHSHTVTLNSGGGHAHDVSVSESEEHAHSITASESTAVNNETGDGQSHTNVQPYVVLNYIVKF